MGTHKIHFKNITSIDHDARGILHIGNSVYINTIGTDIIQLKHVSDYEVKLMNDAYEKYINKHQNDIITHSSDVNEILKYAELYEKGLLTKEEFDKIKEKYL